MPLRLRRSNAQTHVCCWPRSSPSRPPLSARRSVCPGPRAAPGPTAPHIALQQGILAPVWHKATTQQRDMAVHQTPQAGCVCAISPFAHNRSHGHVVSLPRLPPCSDLPRPLLARHTCLPAQVLHRWNRRLAFKLPIHAVVKHGQDSRQQTRDLLLPRTLCASA